MNAPKLDKRTAEELFKEIERRSRSYTPEWQLDADHPDGGAALARIFSEMLFDTADRFNRLPEKHRLEFLNLLDCTPKSPTPAVGFARAATVSHAPKSVLIKKGTQLFADVDLPKQGSVRVPFETRRDIFAAPASLKAIVNTDPAADKIALHETERQNQAPIPLFGIEPRRAPERHLFYLVHPVLRRMKHAAEIRLRISDSSDSLSDPERMKALCSPEFAVWHMISDWRRQRLTARFDGNAIVLTKPSAPEETPRENSEHGAIVCEMTKTKNAAELYADSVLISCRSLDDPETGRAVPPDHLMAGDTELPESEGGYCFGKEPSAYDCFYIACDEAFCKSGAEVTLKFTVTASVTGEAEAEEFEFDNRLLIDKSKIKPRRIDDIRISEVVWEYRNPRGWARLAVRGDTNPFFCQEKTETKTVGFVCPSDLVPTVNGAYENLWIRARIVEIQNRFSMDGRWFLPRITRMNIRYCYGDLFLPVTGLAVRDNSLEKTRSVPVGKRARLFGVPDGNRRTAYLLFDAPPAGRPFNLYFGFAGTPTESRSVRFEYLSAYAGGFRELKTDDATNGFRSDGILSFFAPDDFAERELFGQTGYWIRVIDESRDSAACPKIEKIVENAVEIVQRQSVPDERHTLSADRTNQTLTLLNQPIISCEVWINELSETPLSELRELESRFPERVRTDLGSDGSASAYWVKWEERESLRFSGEGDRHYESDRANGSIRFGDGVHGKIPAHKTTVTVSVRYAFGGGMPGNLPANALKGPTVGIPFIADMTNFEPTCGGSGGQNTDVLLRIAPQRLKHGGKAVTAGDFESIVLEEFAQVEDVRCFGRKNSLFETADGYVTVIVKPYDCGSRPYAEALCERIKKRLEQCSCRGLMRENGLSVLPARVLRVSAEITVPTDDYGNTARIEREMIGAVTELIESRPFGRIGAVPSVLDIYKALKKISAAFRVSGVLLMGEYHDGNAPVLISLDQAPRFGGFVCVNGTHRVKTEAPR